MTNQNTDKGGPQLDLCPACGKKTADSSRAGFLTGFLRQNTRCKCQSQAAIYAERDRAQQVYRPVELAPGVVVGGHYLIIKLIGRGQMGEVYRAQHLTLDIPCAVKFLPPDQVADRSWKRFQIETKSMAKFNHINLVKVTDLGVHEGVPYYVMEFVDGENLAQRLEKKGALPLSVALDVFMQVCNGIGYAHRNGVVHRDLKPANILLVRKPTGKLIVKILDFGLANLIQGDRLKQSPTTIGDLLGSLCYISPEQCQGGKTDNRSDIYSIGCILFESLTGRPPFVGATTVEILKGHQRINPPSLESLIGGDVLPQAMEVVLAKLLAKNPVERYQTLLELRACPKLVQLAVMDMNLDQLLPILTRLTSLQSVTIGGSALSLEQIKSITACPNIRTVLISKKSLSAEVIKSCERPEPKVILSD